MHRIVCAVALAALPLVTLGSTAALAISSQQQCTSSGGTYTKETGTATCIFSTNVANSTNSQTTTTTANGQGNLGNKASSSCSGPGSSTGSSFCK